MRKAKRVRLVSCTSKAFLLIGDNEATRVIFKGAQLAGEVKIKQDHICKIPSMES